MALRELRANGITAAGKQWLTAALDPFHDAALSRTGLPDRYAGASVVEIVTESRTLTAPAGTTGTWSAHVFSLPFLGETYMNPARLVKQEFESANYKNGGSLVLFEGNAVNAQCLVGEQTLPMSLLNVWAWKDDHTYLFPNGGVPYSACKPDDVSIMGAITPGQARVIGAGVEIVNTTAELYKQGTVTVSRVPNSIEEAAMVSTSGDINLGSNPNPHRWTYGALFSPGMRSCYGPPHSTAAALSFPNSRQWAAAEGCYSVLAMDVDEADMKPTVTQHRAVLSSYDVVETDTLVTAPETISVGYAVPTARVHASGTDSVIVPDGGINSLDAASDTTSIMFTGLSKETSLTITFRYIIEKAPRFGDQGGSSLVRLMNPSPSYDPVALELYKEVMGKMLSGVPSKYNPLGEFWNYVVNLVSKAAPVVASIASAIPHPIAQAVGRAATAASVATKALQAVKAIKDKAPPASSQAKKKKPTRK